MANLPMAQLLPVKLPGSKGDRPAAVPSDAMMQGVKSEAKTASQHKKNVSPVLHLKKESAGHRANPSAYHSGHKLAFPKSKG